MTNIKAIISELNNEPYGKELKARTLPPNANAFARNVERLIESLITLYNVDNNIISINTIESVRSISKNEIRLMICTRSRRNNLHLNNYGVDEEMERIVKLINIQIPNILRYE